jgi:hypothetical protein
VAGCGVFLFFMWEFTSCGLFIDGNQGHAFGMRYFVDGAFLFFLGFAVFFYWFCELNQDARLRKIIKWGVVVFLAWNVFFMISYRAKIQPHGEPIAIKRVMTNISPWIRQAKKDINLPKRYMRLEYPLFTPLESEQESHSSPQ